uniref:Uncharacterized protein n=1 Tax=Rhizophora mucronata TaxID=61149 RepID=A0A2P2J576_RHIMU
MGCLDTRKEVYIFLSLFDMCRIWNFNCWSINKYGQSFYLMGIAISTLSSVIILACSFSTYSVESTEIATSLF